jgi:hypothetical protein
MRQDPEEIHRYTPLHRVQFCKPHYLAHIEQGGDKRRWHTANGSQNYCDVLKCGQLSRYIELREHQLEGIG